MKTLLTILLFAIPAFAQYTVVGTSTDNSAGVPIVYFVQDDSIVRKGDEVRFTGGLAVIEKDGDRAVPSKEHYMFSTFVASCSKKTWSELTQKGQWRGEAVNKVIEKPEERTAKKGEIIFTTLNFVCTDPRLKA